MSAPESEPEAVTETIAAKAQGEAQVQTDGALADIRGGVIAQCLLRESPSLIAPTNICYRIGSSQAEAQAQGRLQADAYCKG